MKKITGLLLAVIVCISFVGNHVYAETGEEATQIVENTIYYVDNINGNDANDGNTEESAWKTIDKVNNTIFQPGDKICFKANGTWEGMLHPQGSGNSEAPIILDMYGEGNKPLIQGNGAEAGIKLESQEFWVIRNFDVTNHAEERAIRQGIFINGKTDGITHDIIIEDCEVHDVTGENRRAMPTYESMYWNSGIYVSMPGRSTNDVHYDNVIIRNNYVHDVLTSGIRINQREDFIVDQYHTNVLIEGNTISRTGSDGMIVANCISPLIQYNLCYDAGALGNKEDTKIIAGLWTCGTDDALFQYNEVARTVLFDSDGTAFDTDWGTGGITTFQYNYTHGNQGGFWLDCAGINKDPEHVKTVLRYNVSADDERYIVRAGDMPTELYNNTFYKSEGKLDACFGNAGTKHKFWNNIFCFQGSPDWAGSKYENNLYYPCEANPADAYAISSDPQLLNPMAAGDGIGFADCYKISNTSPCIGTGIYLPDNGGQDFWGTSLTKGAIDIGACQTTITEPQDEDTYVFTRDFSTQQGNRNWFYMEKNSEQYINLIWDEDQQKWSGTGKYNLIWAPGNMHPDENDTVLAWKAPKSGKVQVSGNPRKENSGNDGVNVKIIKNSTQVWPESGWQYISGDNVTGINHNFIIDVVADDMIYFVLNKNQNNYSDGTYWNPMITYHISEKYNFTADFSSEQGMNGWYYLESDGSNYQEMLWDSSINRWKGSGEYSLIWAPAQLHPDGTDTVIGWKAPHNGEITIKGNPKKANVGYDGVKVKILKNDTNVWPESGWEEVGGSDTNGIVHDIKVTVSQNDMIYFVVNQNGNNYSDETNWSPIITYN
ncbi:MAG: right-handed parallel beta-helix repeat-containing protein [Muricomes sp.]|uniref:right-handed parallel beta-helix repeat-containing protein n=1 Tax=Faecalicatena contorta TaxID=39482 RepID=UPI002E9A86C5|nr:right-handed parallel beta-helix repeat-containing protein [Muricomes sp.]